MAGIGFELKKLYRRKGLFFGIRACVLSVFITIGPTVLCILMLTVLQKLLLHWGVPSNERELFMGSILYPFIFSLLLTSGITMTLSRFISDKLYKNEIEDIYPSLNGALSILLLLGGLIGIIFYSFSPLPLLFKLTAYLLFLELNILWIETVYISALREYKKLINGFLMGVVSMVLLAWAAGMLGFKTVLGTLAAVNMGYFIIIVIFAINIQSYFRSNSRKNFAFLEYLDKYPSLVWIGFLYTLGLYIHNFIFWLGKDHVISYSTYRFAPAYDVPSFWAFMSVMPAIVMFVVSYETSFFEKYKAFYDTICSDGTKAEIDQLKIDMLDVLTRQLRHVMGFQFVFSFVCLLLGKVFFSVLGLNSNSFSIFNKLLIGDYAFIIMFICITLLLYFDDRKGALMIVAVFTVSNTGFTVITVYAGEVYYGAGFMGASFLSLFFALFRLQFFLKNIDYYIFCAQPMVPRRYEKIFSRLSRII